MYSLDLFTTGWLLALPAVFGAGLIRGVTGFAQNLVLAPVLLLFMEPKPVVVVNLFLSLIGSIILMPLVWWNLKPDKILPLTSGYPICPTLWN